MVHSFILSKSIGTSRILGLSIFDYKILFYHMEVFLCHFEKDQDKSFKLCHLLTICSPLHFNCNIVISYGQFSSSQLDTITKKGGDWVIVTVPV